MINDDLNEIDSYLNEINKKLTENINEKNDENVFNEAQAIVKLIDKLNKKQKYAKILRIAGFIALIIGLLILFWDYCSIHVIYLARLLIVFVSLIPIKL